jgi:4'-phosphopantetheinyl transferase
VSAVLERRAVPRAPAPEGAPDVLVRRARIDPEGEPADAAAALLSPDEAARAARFRFAKDRDAFVRSRAFLRRVLGEALGREPRALAFTTGAWGKPSLVDGRGLEFSLSHSGALALCALAWRRPVGVDVEEHRAGVEALEIAELFFTDTELATLRALEGAERARAFFLCWTRKEAYVKARGEGLSIPLSRFDVTCAPGEPAHLSGRGDSALEVARWALADLDVGPGYSAAVAALGHGWRPELL